MSVFQVSIVALGAIALTLGYCWYDAKLRNDCIRRIEDWRRF
jgi:hypothetical protein